MSQRNHHLCTLTKPRAGSSAENSPPQLLSSTLRASRMWQHNATTLSSAINCAVKFLCQCQNYSHHCQNHPSPHHLHQLECAHWQPHCVGNGEGQWGGLHHLRAQWMRLRAVEGMHFNGCSISPILHNGLSHSLVQYYALWTQSPLPWRARKSILENLVVPQSKKKNIAAGYLVYLLEAAVHSQMALVVGAGA